MQYVLLIYDSEKKWATMSQKELDIAMKEFQEYRDSMRKSGHFQLGIRLEATGTATSVTARHGTLETIDGPFAETKEQLGGLYVIEAKDEADARAVAARCPGAKYGTVEIRPIMTPSGGLE